MIFIYLLFTNQINNIELRINFIMCKKSYYSPNRNTCFLKNISLKFWWFYIVWCNVFLCLNFLAYNCKLKQISFKEILCFCLITFHVLLSKFVLFLITKKKRCNYWSQNFIIMFNQHKQRMQHHVCLEAKPITLQLPQMLIKENNVLWSIKWLPMSSL